MFPSDLDSSTFNNLFIERLNSEEGREKIADAGASFVRSKIREIGFARRILPPESVTRTDCQRAVDHDTLVKIVDLEYDSKAFAVNFAGQANENYIDGKRYQIPFYKIESEKFVKNEAELLAYDYAITKLIEENSVKDIQKIEDTKFIEYAEVAIDSTGKRLLSDATSLNRRELVKMFNMIDGDFLEMGSVLMHQVDFNDYMVQPATEIGSPLASEITKDGYKHPTLMNRKLVVSNKTDLVVPGDIWGFTGPSYLGNFFILADMKFWIKKEADLVEWKTWEYIGLGFGNIRSIAKLELDRPGIFPVNGTI
jgi:hypothetical protein